MIRICLVRLWSPFVVPNRPGDGREPMVRNKAKRRARYPTIPRFPVYYYSTIPVRCLLRQTNPISGWTERRISVDAERTYDEWDLHLASEKQSQSFDCGLWDRPVASGPLRAIAPNKANFRVTGGTRVVLMGETPMLRIAPNKANFGTA